MERLQGPTLAERLREEPRVPLERALRLAEQMAAGLGAAHRAGVVHRDFKPGNVMLVVRDGAEQAVVTDFGTGQAVSRFESGVDVRYAGSVVGTPAYMAPEQLRGEDVGPAADIYALGLVLWEMVTGASPFAGTRPASEQPPAAGLLSARGASSGRSRARRCTWSSATRSRRTAGASAARR